MASKKDYHLSNIERTYLEQNIPPSQKRIHISFHADIHIGKKKYANAIVGLTEHYILPIVKGFFKGFKAPQLYHIIDINEIDVTNEDEVDINFYNKLPSIKIQSSAVIYFVRSLIRNYVLGLPLLPPHKRFVFHSYDMSKFPLFKPRLSPSQLFQLQYDSECSYLKTNFYNNIAFYYYTLLYYGNPIFNANDLPVYFTEPKFGLSFSLDPIVGALAYCPFTYVFSANSIKSPNLINCAAKLATSNKSCKAIRIRNCGCTTGGKAFLEEFENTDHDYPIYYDISGNKLNDFPYFFKALELVTAPVESLNFEDCSMNEQSILSLFDAINENENLWEISELLIAGNYLNENCTGMFINLMNEFQKSEIFNIIALSFGPTERIEKLTMMIDCCNQPFQHLRIYGTKITPDSTYDLCRYFGRTETLKNIEFIDCDIEDDSFQQILQTLTKNKNIQQLSLNLSGCKLSGIKFSIFMKEISNGLGSKLYNLSLDRNKLTLDELTMFNDSSEKFTILSSLELNGNFNSCPGMNDQIARLLKIPKLESLSLNGLGISALRTDLSQLVSDLKNNNTIKHIDISKNMIGEVGYHYFLDLIKHNNNLITAKFSSSEMKNPSDVLQMLEAIAHHKSLCNICLFREDIIRLLSGQPPQVLNQYSNLLLKAMCKNMENCALINAVPGEFEFAQTALSSVTAASISSLLQLGGAGIGGGGVSTGCPSIDLQDIFLGGILDDSVYELNKLLQFAKPPINQHLQMIQPIFGIPFPFNQESNEGKPIYNIDLDDSRDKLNAKSENENSSDHKKNKNLASLYVDSSLFGLIVDTSKYNPSEDSLLSKSVLKRRPELDEELSLYDPSNVLVQPSMKRKSEEDEEEDHHHADDNDNDNDNHAQIEAPQAHIQASQITKKRQTVRPEFKPEPTKMEDVFNERDEDELEDIHNDDNANQNNHNQQAQKIEEKPAEQHEEPQNEQPAEHHEVIHAEQPVEQHEEPQNEQPAEQQLNQLEEVHNEQQAEQHEQPPTEPPAKTLAEQQIEQHEEHPAEQPAEQHTENPAAPIEQPTEQHEEHPTEQPAEQHTENSAAPPIEQSVEQHEEPPAEQPAEQHEEPHTEQPVEQHTENPAAPPIEQPTEQHEEHPAEQPVEQHEEPLTEQPAEQHTEDPASPPIEQPTEQNGEPPSEQPTEQHEVSPAEQTEAQTTDHHDE